MSFSKVWDISKQLDLVTCDAVDNWTGSDDVTGLATTATHRTGQFALTFDKSDTNDAYGQISVETTKNANIFALHKMKALVNLADLTDVASVSFYIGTSASHNNVYTVADTDLGTGWNEIDINCDDPTSVTGNGVNWRDITYFAFRVTLDGAGDTLSAIILDSVSFYKLNEAGSAGTGEDVNVAEIGGSTVNKGAGAVGTGTQRMTLASDDPAVASLTVIEGAVHAEDDAHTSTDPGVFMLGVRADTAASLGGTDGDYTGMTFDSTNHQWVRDGFAPNFEDQDNARAKTSALATIDSGYGAPNAFFTQAAATQNLVASAATLIGFNTYNASATDYWVQFHDTATTPSGGAAPKRVFSLPAGDAFDIREFGREEPQFANGIAVAISTTHRTYTAGTATDVELNAQYATANLG